MNLCSIVDGCEWIKSTADRIVDHEKWRILSEMDGLHFRFVVKTKARCRKYESKRLFMGLYSGKNESENKKVFMLNK